MILADDLIAGRLVIPLALDELEAFLLAGALTVGLGAVVLAAAERELEARLAAFLPAGARCRHSRHRGDCRLRIRFW